MGARGPKREPTELKKVKGTAKPSRDPDPIATAYGIPANPFDAKDAPDEHQAWMQVVRAMIDTGTHIVLTPADFVAVERCAIALARARQWTAEARRVIAEGNRYVSTRANGIMPHPALREERLARAELDKAGSALGLDPSARSSLSKPGKDGAGGATPAGDDPLMAKLLSIGPRPVAEATPAPKAKRAPAKKRATPAAAKPASKPRAKRTPKPKG